METMRMQNASLCPSPLVLERLNAGELDDPTGASLEEHFVLCGSCRSRRLHVAEGFGGLGVDADRLFDRIAEAEPLRGRGRIVEVLRPRIVMPIVLASAALLLFAPSTDGVRTKGGVSLRVFRERAGQVEEQLSGSAFRAGDRLRFKVALPDDSKIMILGAESDGDVFTYYPSSRSGSASPVFQDDGALVGAIQLDDFRGQEWLHLVRCARSFDTNDITIDGQKVVMPSGCEAATFEMERIAD